MKKITQRLFLALSLTLATATIQPAQATPAAIIEIIRQGVKKVIKAMDLKIQRKQNKVIWLQNAQKVLENALSKLKLKEIAEWTEKQRQLYDDYFQELWKVKSYIAQYQRVRDIVQKQAQLVSEFQEAWQLLRQDDHFTVEEIHYMEEVYEGILEESAENLDRILLVVDAFTTQMSDGQRLEIIHHAEDRLDKNLSDLRSFNTRNFHLSMSRARTKGEIEILKHHYGIE